MLRLIHSKFLPHAVILFHDAGTAGKAIEEIVAFIKGQTAIDGKVTAYVCRDYVCKRPVNDIDALEIPLLSEMGYKKDD